MKTAPKINDVWPAGRGGRGSGAAVGSAYRKTVRWKGKVREGWRGGEGQGTGLALGDEGVEEIASNRLGVHLSRQEREPREG